METVNPPRTTAKSTFECAECEDTGYTLASATPWKSVEGGYPLNECSVCDCKNGDAVRRLWALYEADKRQARLNAIFAGAEVPARYRGLTVGSLVELAGKDKGKEQAIQAAIAFAETGTAPCPKTKQYKPGLLLEGSLGVGKTGLLTPLLNKLVADGKVGLWVEVYDFISRIQSGYASGDAQGRLESAQRADVVLLDDLGDIERSTPETEDRRRIIYQLVNYRHNEGLPMLITTNCSVAQLGHQFGSRTVERIFESCAWLKMGGQNLRGI